MLVKNIIAVLVFGVVFLFAGPVSYYGELKASGNKLVGSKTGSAVQVRGISLGWSNTGWESARFFNEMAINAMVDDWKAEIIRVPYGQDDASNKARIKVAIDAAIAKDVYVIIDWHSHTAHNQTTAAAKFFSEMAREYGAKDNVIFEIFNEPERISWSGAIKPYANTVIDTIRKYSDNLILVGTPNWAQDIDVAVDAITGTNRGNIAYVLHFYAYSHSLTTGKTAGTTKIFRDAANQVLNANLPIFVSEYGTTHADGGQPASQTNRTNNYNTHSAANTDAWHAFMDENKISSCAWNVNDKYEGSAFFGTTQGGTFSQTAANFSDKNMMTESGKYIYDKLNAYADDAEWRNPPPPPPSSSSSYDSPSSSSGSTPIVFKSPDANG
ncbi:MAG: glycoside hydrolase family 5 protein, partial [Candidatus Fibromonas sp.]|nr:glycoside hydrolase family 5 protein [Candidatus Fibromonas sp.]